MINLWDNTPNQPTKFRAKNWVEINDESRGAYNTNSQIRFKTSMSRSSLCDYSDVYLVFKWTIAFKNTDVNKRVIFNKCAPFTSCISRTNNTQIDDAQYIDVVMPMYSLREYSDNHSKTSAILWQYCRDELAVNDEGQLLILLKLMLLLIRFFLNKK